eukprot:CAMPEP_0171481376 /NCGR_PEP_ID=MMETSP0946-20130122/6702_1 /TAXON_ID=109269 /ORGANISM="Vaucheria litorea, Strain CCMP2940" /LENGTH=175 /DNA_ID=CAMNT_0012012923 /DNA_START=75 /DNA_END=598 /DNA_ORIENTATION=+
MAKEFNERSHFGEEKESRVLYAGYFLDHVVTPIWDVVCGEQRPWKKDHIEARNYDDFNEFFWRPSCLQYSYTDISSSNVYTSSGDELLFRPKSQPKREEGVQPVYKGLESMPKTFIEKRSILSCILTFRRLLEFHILVFYVSSMYAFGKCLIWDDMFMIKMISSTFWLMNLLSIV